MLIVVIPALLAVAALFLIYFFKLYAVVACSLIGAAYCGFVFAALRGFGNPTGHVPTTSIGEWLLISLWALIPISVALLSYFFLLQVLKGEGPAWPLGVTVVALIGMYLLYRLPPYTWSFNTESSKESSLHGELDAPKPDWMIEVGDRYRNAMADATGISDFLSFTGQALESAPNSDKFGFEIADYCTKLMINRLRADDYANAERILEAYTDVFLPHAGTNRKTEDVASMGIALSIVSEQPEIAESVFENLLPAELEIESIRNDVLLYNLASHYAISRDKTSLLRAARTAVSLGKTARQFLDDADFAGYLDDEEFLDAIGAAD